MKKLMVIVFVGCALVLSHGVRNVAAQAFQLRTPLKNLAGTYAYTSHGSFALCFTNTPPVKLADCGSPGVRVIPLTLQDVGVGTFDTNGNECVTTTEVVSAFQDTATPDEVAIVQIVFTTTSFDLTTGISDGSFTGYVGGKCNGATFDPTGATAESNGTFHEVLSDRGKRLDFVLTADKDAKGSLGSASVSGTQLRQ